MKIKPIFSAISLLAACVSTSVFADISSPDFSAPTGPAYVKSLYASDSESAVAFKKAVANGWASREKAIAKAKAAGIQVHFKYHTVSKDQNAAPYYEKWIKLKRDANFEFPQHAETLGLGKYINSPADIAQVRKLIADNPAIFKELHLAVEKKDHAWFDGSGGSFPVYGVLRGAVRDLRTEGFSLALQNRYDDALTVEKDALRVSCHIYELKSIMGYLIGDACQSITLGGYRDLLAVGGDRPGYARKIADIIRNNAVETSVSAPYREYEASYNWALLESFRQNSYNEFLVQTELGSGGKVGDPVFPKGQDLKTLSPDELKLWNNLFYQAEADYLNNLVQIVRILDIHSASEEENLIPQMNFTNSVIKALNGIEWDFSHIVTPDKTTVGIVVAKNADSKADIQITLAACEAFDVKSKTGQFPSALSGSSIDPWTEKPIGYKKTVDGFIVYSVGRDHAFNGDIDNIPQGTHRIYYKYPIKQIPRPNGE